MTSLFEPPQESTGLCTADASARGGCPLLQNQKSHPPPMSAVPILLDPVKLSPPPPQLHLPALGRAFSPQPQSALPMEPGACHLPERREPATGTWQCGNPCHLSPGTQSTRAANRTHLQDRGCPTPDLGPLSPQLLHHHSNAPWVARRVGHKWMGTKIHPKFHLSSQTLTWGCNPPEDESFL